MDCIFCKIIEGKIPSAKIYEDDNFIAFMDIAPIARGHCLVIPKHHCRNVLDTPDYVAEKFYPVIVKISRMVKKAFNADGVNIMQFNEPSAGQEVFHAHVHIIPRYENDNLGIKMPSRLNVTISDIQEDAMRIKANC